MSLSYNICHLPVEPMQNESQKKVVALEIFSYVAFKYMKKLVSFMVFVPERFL